LRDDQVITQVRSRVNANRTLTARFRAHSTQFGFTTLAESKKGTLRFPFHLDPMWKTDRLGIVVFAQDRKSGEVYQTAFVRWEP
jgi:hypothetical protein